MKDQYIQPVLTLTNLTNEDLMNTSGGGYADSGDTIIGDDEIFNG